MKTWMITTQNRGTIFNPRRVFFVAATNVEKALKKASTHMKRQGVNAPIERAEVMEGAEIVS